MIKRQEYLDYMKSYKKTHCKPISKMSKAELKVEAERNGFLQHKFKIKPKITSEVTKTVKVKPKITSEVTKTVKEEPIKQKKTSREEKKELFKKFRELGIKIQDATTVTEARVFKRQSDAIKKRLLDK